MKSYTFKMGLVGAGLFVGFYALCMLWGMPISDSVLQTLHYNLLQIAYPGFAYTTIGLLWGLLESILYGFGFGVLFVWLTKVCCVTTHR